MKISFRLAAITLCGGICLGFSYAQTLDHVMFQGNPQHTGAFETKPVYRFDHLRFVFKTGGPIRSTAAIVRDMVYIGSGDGNLYAIDINSGKERWRFNTGGAVHSSPAIAGGVVYFTSRDHFLRALNAMTGKQIWQFEMGRDLPYQNGFDYYLSSPTIDGQTLYVGGGDGNLYAFNIATQQLAWMYPTGSRIRATPAVTNTSVLIGAMDGILHAVDKGTGTLKWKFATHGASLKIEDFGFDRSAIVSSASIADSIVTFGCRDGFLYALDLESGAERWHYDHKISWVLSTPARSDGSVFAGSSDAQFMQSVDEKTGREVWRFKTGGPVWSSAAIAGTVIYFGSNDGNLFALNGKTGRELWRFKMNDRIFASPVISDGVVYCGSDDGSLYALTGSVIPDTLSVRPRKAVFWDSKPGSAGTWFTSGTDEWIRDCFKREGYAVVDAKELEQFMTEQRDMKSRSVVVFADNRVPDAVAEDSLQTPLIRRYLDAGGKIVWLGSNPLAWKRDSTGKLLKIDYAIPEKILGIQFPGRQLEGIGWYGTTVTEEGRRWGLSGWGVGLGWVDPRQVSTVLATDEYGMASAWVKNYGGPEGTGLVQLWIPRDRHIDLYPVKQAAELGIQ